MIVTGPISLLDSMPVSRDTALQADVAGLVFENIMADKFFSGYDRAGPDMTSFKP